MYLGEFYRYFVSWDNKFYKCTFRFYLLVIRSQEVYFQNMYHIIFQPPMYSGYVVNYVINNMEVNIAIKEMYEYQAQI